MKIWQAYEMGCSVGERHPSLKPKHSHAVYKESGLALCNRVKSFSLCWDTSLLKDAPPTCPACLNVIAKLDAPKTVAQIGEEGRERRAATLAQRHTGKHRIRMNRYGNWCGYAGNRRVVEFGANEVEAVEWLKGQQRFVVVHGEFGYLHLGGAGGVLAEHEQSYSWLKLLKDAQRFSTAKDATQALWDYGLAGRADVKVEELAR